MTNLSELKVSNPKVWILIGGIVILAETRRRRLKSGNAIKEDLGSFIERLELFPFPQPPPPAAWLPLSGLTFAIKDIMDINGFVTGFGSVNWKRTHEAASKTAVVVTALLKNGATCVGKTIMDELGFGVRITRENSHYGLQLIQNCHLMYLVVRLVVQLLLLLLLRACEFCYRY